MVRTARGESNAGKHYSRRVSAPRLPVGAPRRHATGRDLVVPRQVRGWRGILAGEQRPLPAWRELASDVFDCREFAEFTDEPRGVYRVAVFEQKRLTGCLFLGPAEGEPQWDAVKTLFEIDVLSEAQRRAVLSGRSTDALPANGPLVCACFGVGLNLIRTALEQGASSVTDIGAALRAGTNCGSCLPELKKIVNESRVAQTV